MPISSVQQGLIVENEYAKFFMMGSGGRVELARPMTDDERRDLEIHIRGEYGMGFAGQIKSAIKLHKMSKNVRYLNIFFDVAESRLINSPFFWYFFAQLDLNIMGLADPTFAIPSKEFHILAAPIKHNGIWRFSMAANMESESRDQWHRFRVPSLELGQFVLQLSADLKKKHSATAFPRELLGDPDVVFLRRSRPREQ